MQSRLYTEKPAALSAGLIERNTPRNTGWYDPGHISPFYSFEDPRGVQVIGAGLEVLQGILAKGQRISLQREALHQLLPFCFTQLDNGQWLALNRDYRPVPMGSREMFPTYEAFADLAVPARRLTFRWAAFSSGDRWFMFDDRTAPWLSLADGRRYMTRMRGVLGVLERDRQ